MNGRYFLDTNVFVYSFDDRAPRKRQKAQALIEEALADRRGMISFQVVQEFLNVALKKFQRPLSIPEGKHYLDRVLSPLCEIFPSISLYRLSLDVKEDIGLSFYDALIVASALQGGCLTIYSEDLPAGKSVSGVTVRNPFEVLAAGAS